MSVDLQSGRATVTPKPGASISPSAIFEAIRHAGLRPDGVTIEASGEMKQGRFFLPGVAEPYLRIPDPAPADSRTTIKVRVLPDGLVQVLPP